MLELELETVITIIIIIIRNESFIFITVKTQESACRQSLTKQEAQLSERGRAMPRVVEYFG